MISGVSSLGAVPPGASNPRNVIVILGPTGAGKSTQAKLLSERLGLPHISTGDLYRSEVSQTTDLATLIKYHETISPRFIPEELMIGMLIKRLMRTDCKQGFILDGFPRSVSRAKIFKNYLCNDKDRVNFFVLHVRDPQIILTRLETRYICEACNKQVDTKKLNNQSKCPVCGNDLMKRPDENNPFKIKQKLANYNTKNLPIQKYLDGFFPVHTLNVKEGASQESLFNEMCRILNIHEVNNSLVRHKFPSRSKTTAVPFSK